VVYIYSTVDRTGWRKCWFDCTFGTAIRGGIIGLLGVGTSAGDIPYTVLARPLPFCWMWKFLKLTYPSARTNNCHWCGWGCDCGWGCECGCIIPATTPRKSYISSATLSPLSEKFKQSDTSYFWVSCILDEVEDGSFNNMRSSWELLDLSTLKE